MALRFVGMTAGVLLAAIFGACSGGSQPTVADASRLLDQATFGVVADDVAHVRSVGFGAYLTEQLGATPSQYTGFSYAPDPAPADCRNHPASPTDAASLCARDRYSLFQVQRQFFIHALTGRDQLRQRVAFALSQIFVVSGSEIYEAYGMADYQNMLLRDAFGNFRILLRDVTLSPVMGHYLDMADNDKTNSALGTSPNENYGREILQLCSIGSYDLNPDGSRKVDRAGAPIPAYDQNVVEGFSSVFTGWTYAPLAGAGSHWTNPRNYDGVMIAFADHHERGAKTLLNGVTLPAGQTPEQDLELSLDNIFNHPNVGPFIGKLLIQHLVTSNPSPAYVARISAVFANNGSGVRGDMGAVVKAILTDSEARGDAPAASHFGHLREPALFITAVLRSLGGQSDGVLPRSAASEMGQPIYSAGPVFDSLPPSFVLPGSSAPEFAANESSAKLARANFVNTVIMQGGAPPDPTVQGSQGTRVDLTSFASVTEPNALISRLNQVLMHGELSGQLSASILTDLVNAESPPDPLRAARTGSYTLLTSDQYQVVR